eukprot:m.370494 g.370494  ORF g.370494 m.370494 type:complete len:228 (-) comp54450_c0_seq1:179-862(-)
MATDSQPFQEPADAAAPCCGCAAKCDRLQQELELLTEKLAILLESAQNRRKTIQVDGLPNVSYPVLFRLTNLGRESKQLSVTRNYSDLAPQDPPANTWAPRPTSGSLLLELKFNLCGWASLRQLPPIQVLTEQYCHMVGGVEYVAHGYAMCVWLRGGGATYELSANFNLTENATQPHGWGCPQQVPFVEPIYEPLELTWAHGEQHTVRIEPRVDFPRLPERGFGPVV